MGVRKLVCLSARLQRAIEALNREELFSDLRQSGHRWGSVGERLASEERKEAPFVVCQDLLASRPICFLSSCFAILTQPLLCPACFLNLHKGRQYQVGLVSILGQSYLTSDSLCLQFALQPRISLSTNSEISVAQLR